MLAYGINIFNEKSKASQQIILFAKFLFIFLVTIWIVGFISPNLFNTQNTITNYILKRIYSPVCHQDHNKCIIINSNPTLICARCAGIYFGALIAGIVSVFFLSRSIKIKTLLLVLLPIAIDVTFTTLGFYSYSKTLAFFTGLIFGTIVFLFLLNEFQSLFLNKKNRNE